MLVWHNYFTSREQVITEIEATGMLHVDLDQDSVMLISERHAHDFDALFYILEGAFPIRDEELGISYRLGPGCKVFVPAGGVHSERYDHFRLLATAPLPVI